MTKPTNIIYKVVSQSLLLISQFAINGVIVKSATTANMSITKDIIRFLNNVLLPLARFKPIVASSKNKSVKIEHPMLEISNIVVSSKPDFYIP